MSTAPTKVIKTVKGFNAWTKTWWMRVPEPRDISLIFTAVYVLAFTGGVIAFVAPPQSITGVAGPILLGTIGAFLLLGSVIGMIAGARENWKLERIGVWFMGGAIFVYGVQVAILQAITPGMRWLQLVVVTIALLIFVLRYRLVRIYTYRPRG